MKLKHSFFLLALSSFALFSCNNDKKNTDTVVTTDTLTTETTPVATVAQQANREGTAVVVTTEQVPEPVRTSFTTKYPKLQKIEWYTYSPVAEDDMMDDTYYYVRFNDRGADYTSWYNNRGEWVKTSTVVPGPKSLPDAVNKYINANYPDYTIEQISKENDKDMDMYEIKLNKGDSKVKLKILPNGEVFKRKTN